MNNSGYWLWSRQRKRTSQQKRWKSSSSCPFFKPLSSVLDYIFPRPDITIMADWAQRKQTPFCFPSIVLRELTASWKKEGQFAEIFGSYIVFLVPDSSCPYCFCWCSCACTSCAWSTSCSPLPSCCVRLWTSSWRRILMAFLQNLCHSKRLVCV